MTGAVQPELKWEKPWDRLAIIKRHQHDAYREAKNATALADVLDAFDIWIPWMIEEIERMNHSLRAPREECAQFCMRASEAYEKCQQKAILAKDEDDVVLYGHAAHTALTLGKGIRRLQTSQDEQEGKTTNPPPSLL